MKTFFYALGVLAALVIAFKIWSNIQAKKVAAIWPRKGDAQAAMESAVRDTNSLSAMRMVLPPSASMVRTTVGTLDLNKLGGNVNGNVDLLSIQRWSPLGGTVTW